MRLAASLTPPTLDSGPSGSYSSAELPQITFHDLRHTCTLLLFQRNVHPKFVQELLRHASVAITLDTYCHMIPGMGGEAADAIGEALG